MKFLVLSITTGEGHNATAGAVREGFLSLGCECDILDTYEHINHLFAKALDKGYLAVTKNLDKPYAFFYERCENRKTVRETGSAIRTSNSLVAKKLYNYINEYSPDGVVVTHPFAAVLVDVIKSKYGLDCGTYGIVTDFCVHPYWEEATGFDYIVTASELLSPQCIKKGFGLSQILPTGIPIRPKFAYKNDKAQMREKHGLDREKFTVLLMSGSMGYGNITKTVCALDRLDMDFQIIVVCGKNEKAYKSVLSGRYTKNVVCFGFVAFIDELMDAADCIVSKPGGLTSSEALAKGLPIIIVNPIPGVEDRNTEFLCNNGAAMRTSRSCSLSDAIYQYFYYPQKIDNMKSNVSLLAKPDSAMSLCSFALDRAKNKV